MGMTSCFLEITETWWADAFGMTCRGKWVNKFWSVYSSGTEDNLSDQEKSDECEKADRIADDTITQEKPKTVRRKIMLHRRHSYGAWSRSLKRVDKVYTIGCFDLFHDGHVKLFQRLRTLGKQVSKR